MSCRLENTRNVVFNALRLIMRRTFLTFQCIKLSSDIQMRAGPGHEVLGCQAASGAKQAIIRRFPTRHPPLQRTKYLAAHSGTLPQKALQTGRLRSLSLATIVRDGERINHNPFGGDQTEACDRGDLSIECGAVPADISLSLIFGSSLPCRPTLVLRGYLFFYTSNEEVVY